MSLANAAGTAFEARALARPTGPKLVKEGGRLALNTSGGCIIFPVRPGKPKLNANKNFSLWLRIKPLRSPAKEKQGLATAVGRWQMFRSLDGRLELNFGPHLRNILKGRGPQLENGRWYDLGFSFEGDADPSDLHQGHCHGVSGRPSRGDRHRPRNVRQSRRLPDRLRLV